MQLYVFPPSPNSLCCQAVANHAGIELELIPLNLGEGEHMAADFIKLNPNHKIPTLVDGDFTLWESGAIMLYLAEQAPASGLIPDDAKTRAQMTQWMFWKTAHFAPACGVYTFENVVKPMLGMGEPDPAEIEKAGENFHRFFTVLDEYLQGREVMVGDAVTLADHAIASWLYPAEPSQYPMDAYKEVKRWSQGILDSAAWQQALASIPAH